MKILMICLGNICRSPMAEGIMQKKIEENELNWIVDSAGTGAYHIGEPPHHLSQKVADEHGIDISKQTARQFSKEDFKNYDKIYAMDENVYHDILSMKKDKDSTTQVDLLLNESFPNENRSVPDPWFGGEDGFHHAWELISNACTKIIEKYP